MNLVGGKGLVCKPSLGGFGGRNGARLQVEIGWIWRWGRPQAKLVWGLFYIFILGKILSHYVRETKVMFALVIFV